MAVKLDPEDRIMRWPAAFVALIWISCGFTPPEPGPGQAVLLFENDVDIEYVDGRSAGGSYGGIGIEPGRRAIGFVLQFRTERGVISPFPLTVPTPCWVTADFAEASYRIEVSSRVAISDEDVPGPSVWVVDEDSNRIARAYCGNYIRKEIPTPCRVVSPVEMPPFEGNLAFPPEAHLKGESAVLSVRLSLSRDGRVKRASVIEMEPRSFGSRSDFGTRAFSHWQIRPDSIVPDLTERVHVRCTLEHPASGASAP